jgi:tRNA-splicing ligase RtcB (3'-phosphate/5'-hydroxy nucleic acid ligase)
MDTNRFTQIDPTTWRIEPHGAMRVPAIIYADAALIRDMDDKVYEQAANVAAEWVSTYRVACARC